MDHEYRANTVGISCGTLLSGHRGDPADFEQSVRAAAAAGFPSVALFTQLVTGYGVDAAVDLLADAGVVVPALDAALSWSDGAEAAARDASEHLDVAAALGARVLQAVRLGPTLDSLSRAAEGLGTLCERAAVYGVAVSIEFVPFTAIPDLATAWSIVQESGAGNGGICLDMLHWQRQPGGPDFELLARIPADRICYVQVCDAPADAPDSRDGYLAQAMSARELPGDGVVDIPTLLDALAAQGADPYFAFEVFSTDLLALGADEMAKRVHASTARCFR